MASEYFRITGMKDVLQVHSFQMRSTAPSESPRAFGTRPLSESSQQGLRDDTTARDVSTIRRYSKSFQEPNGELNVDITLEPIRNGGAIRRYRLHGGTLPAPTGNVPLPRGEEPRDGLALVVQFFIDAAERVEVDLHVPNCEPFGGKCHCKEPPGYVFDV